MINKKIKNEEKIPLTQNFQIDVEILKTITNKYKQRKNSDDISYLKKIGGLNFIKNNLKTCTNSGIKESSIPDRIKYFGSNKKEKIKIKSFLLLILEQLNDAVLIIFIIAGIVSIIINLIVEDEHREIAWIEGFTILLAVIIVVIVTAINNLKKEKEFQKLNKQAESGKRVSVVRDGIRNDDLQIQDIIVGDLLIIKGGIEIPGDGIIVESNLISVDESSMTGETKHMKKENLETCLKKRDMVLKEKYGKKNYLPSPIVMAGTKVLTGTGKMIIINIGKNSAIGQIKDLLITGEEELTPLQQKLQTIATQIGILGFITGTLIFFILLIRMIEENSRKGWNEEAMVYVREILEYFIIAIAILVIAIPEGLPLAVTLSLAFTVNKMMKDKNLVRKLQACETMGGANIICSDKTGTLTRNEMFFTNFWNGENIEIYNSEKNKAEPYQNFILEKEAEDFFIDTIILNSVEDPKQKNGNPTELSILKYFDFLNFDIVDYRKKNKHTYFQAPFSSDRKRMSTIIKTKNNDYYCYIKGASEYMVECSTHFHDLKTNKIFFIDENFRKEIHESINKMASKALRTIGIAYKKFDDIKKVDLEYKDYKGVFEFENNDFVLIGICGIKDIIRSEVPKSIEICRKAGIDVKMVTGDNKITAYSIAKEINLIKEKDDSLILEGPEFFKLIEGIVCLNCKEKEICDCVRNKYELAKKENKNKKIRKDSIKNLSAFEKIAKKLKVLARSRPEDKYALVIGLKQLGNVVSVTGDGTNDAPALKKADVGFAMNISGTEVAKQASDILIMDDNFASIVQAVKWGRNIYDSIRKFLQFQLTVNIGAVFTTFVSASILKEAIFSPVQMFWINLIMDTLAALALATEPPTDKLLNRPPHSKHENIISPLMLKHIIGQTIFQSIIIFTIVFAGENFLFDKMFKRQLQNESGILIVNGRKRDGYKIEDHDNQYSLHYTYNFNIFVMLQLFNLINCRIHDDKFNIFFNICKSHYFLTIWICVFCLQILFLTFLGRAIRVTKWGLDPISWLLCIAIGMLSFIWSFFLKFIPFEKIPFGKICYFKKICGKKRKKNKIENKRKENKLKIENKRKENKIEKIRK